MRQREKRSTRKYWRILRSVFAVILAVAGASGLAQAQQEKEIEPRFTYHESDGIFLFYETDQKEAYRRLLPREFEVPERLLVQVFIADFYKMDARTKPYKEGAILLLAEYKGKEAWHCIAMPVTSRESMLGGIWRMGLPKTMGEIELTRKAPKYSGSVKVENGYGMSLSLDTTDYTIGEDEEKLLKELTIIPKLNIRRGKVVEMTRSANGSVIDTAKKFPRRLTLVFGKGAVSFDVNKKEDSEETTSEDSGKPDVEVHAFKDLVPTKIIGAYYLKNSFTYRLGVK